MCQWDMDAPANKNKCPLKQNVEVWQLWKSLTTYETSY